MQVAVWSPRTDLSMLVFVVNNSLYYVNAPYWDKAMKIGPVPEECVLQGVADLLYQEKIWHSKAGLWFSPSGDWLAFSTFQHRPSRGGEFCYSGVVRRQGECGGLPWVGRDTLTITILSILLCRL